jgi:RNA polymerase sigma-70 factor (family 1)
MILTCIQLNLTFTFTKPNKKSLKLFPDDNELVERLQKGDVEAFDLLYEKYSGKLYSFSLKYLRSVEEAEELVQSTFLKIWENHKQLDKDLSFKSYLFTISYNDICKFFRKRNYMQQFLKDSISENSLASSETEKSIDYQSVLTRVQQIADKLPEKQKNIFRKSRQEGKSSKEIAEELSLSPGTVDNYISEALKFIRRRLVSEDIAFLFFFSSFFLSSTGY